MSGLSLGAIGKIGTCQNDVGPSESPSSKTDSITYPSYLIWLANHSADARGGEAENQPLVPLVSNLSFLSPTTLNVFMDTRVHGYRERAKVPLLDIQSHLGSSAKSLPCFARFSPISKDATSLKPAPVVGS